MCLSPMMFSGQKSSTCLNHKFMGHLGEDIYLSIKYYIVKGFANHQSHLPANDNQDQKFVITHRETT